MLVKFNGSLTQAQYDALGTKDAGTLYFTTDTKRIYKGSTQYSSGTGVTGLSYNATSDVFTITYADGTTGTISFAAELSAKENTANKGVAGGYASLGDDGKVPSSQLPAFVDDVIDLVNIVTTNPTSGMTAGQKYYNSTSKKIFTATSATAGTESAPVADAVYVNVATNKTYRWGGSDLVVIGSDLALGETSSTAYRGDRGKTAYDHSQATGNPHGATAAQVGAAPSSHVGAGGATQHPLGNGTTPGFSTNDYTATEKTKLAGLSNTPVENVLTSDSTTNALSAAQGKALKTLADGKMTKQTGATAGEIVVFGAGGEAADSNKTFVTSISATSTDAQVPTAKAVVDAISWA
jgi:hypothetical protein